AHEGSERATSNRTKLRERAERLSARKRRWLIREKLRSGRLPYDRPAIVCGGPGNGGICAGREKPTLRAPLVMAIPAAVGASVVSLDADCFELWDVLRRPTPRM